LKNNKKKVNSFANVDLKVRQV